MSFLTQDYRRTVVRKSPNLYTGLDAKAHALAGRYKNIPWTVFRFLDAAKKIDAQAPFWENMSDDKLQQELADLKQIFRRRARGFEQCVPIALAAASLRNCSAFSSLRTEISSLTASGVGVLSISFLLFSFI